MLSMNNPHFLQRTLGLICCLLMFSAATADGVWLYKTKPGDNLWNITERHLKDMKYWTDLQRINRLPDPDYIRPGTIIRVPIELLKTKKAFATLTFAVGKVTIKGVDKQPIMVPTNQEFKLLEGTTVTTGDDGLVSLLFQDGSRLLLQNNSELVLSNLGAYGDGSLTNTQIYLEQGRVDNDVHSLPRGETRFEVRTKTAVTSARGTKFRVSADKGNTGTIAEVLKGRVVVGSKQKPEDLSLTPGYGAVIDPITGKSVRQELPVAPDTNELPKFVDRLPVRIPVKTQKGVAQYRIFLASQAKPEELIKEITCDKTALTLGDIPDGNYLITVRAINEAGLEGEDMLHAFTLAARPEPPTLTTPEMNEIVLENEPSLNWLRQLVARRYHVQIATDVGFKQIVQDDMVTSVHYRSKKILKEGTYYWRIATVDAHKEGPFSDVQRFRYVNAQVEMTPIEGNKVQLRWRDAGPDIRYRVELAYDRNFEQHWLTEITTKNTLDVKPAMKGIYYMRIQMIMPDGTTTRFSRPQQIEFR